MARTHSLALGIASLFLAPVAALAQVESVEILTSGVSCGVCAVVSEVQFRRMEGIERVAISLPKESITLYYKPGAGFSLPAIQSVLEPLKVQILRIRMTARGNVEDGPEDRKTLIAGRNRFLLRLPREAGNISPKEQLFLEGLLIGSGETMEYRVATITRREDGGKGHETRQ